MLLAVLVGLMMSQPDDVLREADPTSLTVSQPEHVDDVLRVADVIGLTVS